MIPAFVIVISEDLLSRFFFFLSFFTHNDLLRHYIYFLLFNFRNKYIIHVYKLKHSKYEFLTFNKLWNIKQINCQIFQMFTFTKTGTLTPCRSLSRRFCPPPSEGWSPSWRRPRLWWRKGSWTDWRTMKVRRVHFIQLDPSLPVYSRAVLLKGWSVSAP